VRLGDVVRGAKKLPVAPPPAPTIPSKPKPVLSPRASTSFADSFRTALLNWVDANDRPHGGVEGYLRASGIHEVCGRREAIYSAGFYEEVPVQFSLGSRLTMDVGSSMHEWWQNKYLGPAQFLWGPWFCHSCQKVSSTGLMPEKCPVCGVGRRSLEYQEIEAKDDVLKYAGHPDGLLIDFTDAITLLGNLVRGKPLDPETLFELKSISSYGYKKLTEPHPEHYSQVHAYMRLLKVPSALVVYVDRGSLCDWTVKDGTFTAGEIHVKVYHVVFDAEYWAAFEHRIEEFWRARALVDREADPKALASPKDITSFERICYSAKSPMAKKCACAAVCFEAGTP